jgi:glycosyltransferase involved in cell wall biosynthesis
LASKALVSVIIPSYNAEAYLSQTLECVLAQTYQAFEVIVVDDGSSDGTCAIVEEFVKRDPRFQLIRQSNAGVGAARNAGIRKARGQYIAPLDADDVWFPEKLAKQVARMEQGGDQMGLVACWCRYIDEHGQDAHSSPPWRIEGRVRHALVLRNIIDNASMPLIRAAALQEVGLYLTRAEQGGAQGCEDWDLHLRIAERFQVGFVFEHLMAYRLTGSSMSTDPAGMDASFLFARRRARLRNPDLPPDAFRWSAGTFYQYIIGKCYAWGRPTWCLHYLKKAVLANPILLTHLWIHQIFLESLRDLATGSAKPRFNSFYTAKKSRLRFLNTTFHRIQDARWSAALRDQT